MTTPTEPPEPAEKPTVYRGPGAFVGGAIVLLFCVGGAVDLMAEEGRADLPGAAVLLLVASLAFAYGVYPAAFSRRDTLVVRNPMRTIRLSWGAVTRMTAQLSFIVFTARTKYTVWAVPVSLRDRRKAERNRLKEMAKQRRDERRGGSRFGGADSFGTPRAHPGSELDRLSYADQAISEMGGRREAWMHSAGLDPEAPAPESAAEEPAITWNKVTIVPILVCVAFVIVAILVH
jgi:hypothetical protein